LRYISPPSTQFVGQHIIYEATCASTNSWAAYCLEQKDVPDGTVVITSHQYQGRGQRSRTWHSEPNQNLTFSVILYPVLLSPQQSFQLNIIITLAIQQVLSSYIPHGLRIKWPNDIYYQDKKMGGILIENTLARDRFKISIIGIGLNVNQLSFNLPIATSLSLVCQRTFHLPQLLEQLLVGLERNYLQLQRQGIAPLKAAYLQNMYWIHEAHTFQDAHHIFKGTIKGINAKGQLVVEQIDNTLKCYNVQELTFIA